MTILFLFCFLPVRSRSADYEEEVRMKNNFFKDKTKIQDPFSLRDPFKEVITEKKKVDDAKAGKLKDGVFTNLPTIEDVPLSQIAIIAVLVGKERRALAIIKGAEEDTVILKEGMLLGRDNAEIKAILPGGIVLVEKIINVYGQEEYLETIIPITETHMEKEKEK